VLALTLSASVAARAGEIYKYLDPDGHVVYSDRAPTKAAPKAAVKVDRPNPADVARLARETEIQKAEEQQRNQKKVADDQLKAQQEHDQQVRCQNARDLYYSMKDARLLYERDAEGNRIYLSDPDADAKREQARVAMTAACGN
jgi:hypothetical protein